MTTANLFFQAMDSWVDGLIEIESTGVIVRVNKTATSILGWTAEELVGGSLHSILCNHNAHTDHGEADCPFHQYSEDVIRAKETFWVHKNQEIVDVNYRIKNIDSDSEDSTHVVIFQSCDNLGYHVNELRKLSTFTSINPAPLLELDAQGIMLFSNPSMNELMLDHGFDDEGKPLVLPKNMPDIIRECLSSYEIIENIESCATDINDYECRRYFMWSCHPLVVEDYETVLLCGVDITSKKEKDIQQDAYEKTFELEKEKTRQEYIGKMVHELRSPLNIVVGYANVLKSTLQAHCSQSQLSLFEGIISGGQELANQISETLELSRVESGILKAEFVDYVVNGDVADVVSRMTNLAEEKGLDLSAEISNEQSRLYADKFLVKQVLVNLISNAIKYTEEGSIEVRLYNVDHDEIGAAIAICIVDTGVGISEKEQETVFSIFSRQEIHEYSDITGDGIGLSVCVEIVNLHSGRLELSSTLGEGSEFTAFFPLYKP